MNLGVFAAQVRQPAWLQLATTLRSPEGNGHAFIGLDWYQKRRCMKILVVCGPIVAAGPVRAVAREV